MTSDMIKRPRVRAKKGDGKSSREVRWERREEGGREGGKEKE